MEVILLERVNKLGQMGDVVRVKDGYARNFLLPQNKALRATESNRAVFDAQKAQLEAQNLEQKKDAEAVAKKLEGQSFTIIRQAGEAGQLYGSVNNRDIAQQVTTDGYTVARGQVVLNKPIKTIGMHEISLTLHPEVTVSVTLNVARSEEEAERQAKGEILIGKDDFADDDEDSIAAEEVFEREDLAQAAEEELGEPEEGSQEEASETESEESAD